MPIRDRTMKFNASLFLSRKNQMPYDTVHGMVFQLHMVCLKSFIQVNKKPFILCYLPWLNNVFARGIWIHALVNCEYAKTIHHLFGCEFLIRMILAATI
jgi:hypothetical protein